MNIPLLQFAPCDETCNKTMIQEMENQIPIPQVLNHGLSMWLILPWTCVKSVASFTIAYVVFKN